MNFLTPFTLIADAAGEVAAEGGGQAAGPAGFLGGGMGSFLPIILMIGVFYFLLIRPQQRKEKERLKLISELRAGQRVMFAGGIAGTVVEAREHTFMIEVAPGVKIEVARGAVSRTLAEGETVKNVQ